MTQFFNSHRNGQTIQWDFNVVPPLLSAPLMCLRAAPYFSLRTAPPLHRLREPRERILHRNWQTIHHCDESFVAFAVGRGAVRTVMRT